MFIAEARLILSTNFTVVFILDTRRCRQIPAKSKEHRCLLLVASHAFLYPSLDLESDIEFLTFAEWQYRLDA